MHSPLSKDQTRIRASESIVKMALISSSMNRLTIRVNEEGNTDSFLWTDSNDETFSAMLYLRKPFINL